MKTATIRTNHIFGTSRSYCADVFYRGCLLTSFEGNNNPQQLTDKARAWAHAHGHMRTGLHIPALHSDNLTH